METLVLLNPTAGGCDHPVEMEDRLASELPDARVQRCGSAEEGRQAVRDALAAGSEMVVAAGGDGTVHTVLNAMGPDFDRAALAIVPLGTANDLVRSLSLPADVSDAIDAILVGRTRVLDVIEVRAEGGDDAGVRYCVNVVAGGFAGRVREDVDEDDKSRWGPLSYARAGVEHLKDVDTWQVDLDLEGGSGSPEGPQRIVNIVVANGSRAGGNIPVAPDADPGDGLLEVVWIRDSAAAELGAVALRMVAGRHLEDERVEARRARAVRVRSDPVMPFTLDGEPLSSGDVEFRVLPGVLRVVVGAAGGGAPTT